jgi:hypothetical protein
MKHWTPKTMLGLIPLTNYVIAPIAKKTKKELCLQFPLVLPYVSLQFFSQSLFEVIKQRQNPSYDERFTLGFTKAGVIYKQKHLHHMPFVWCMCSHKMCQSNKLPK